MQNIPETERPGVFRCQRCYQDYVQYILAGLTLGCANMASFDLTTVKFGKTHPSDAKITLQKTFWTTPA